MKPTQQKRTLMKAEADVEPEGTDDAGDEADVEAG